MITITKNVISAKEEIASFLASKEAGIRSQFKKSTLINAAQDMFTAKGLTCPIVVKEGREGEAYLLNRDILSSTATSNSE